MREGFENYLKKFDFQKWQKEQLWHMEINSILQDNETVL